MPRLDQTAGFRDIVYDQGRLGVAVVHGREGSETLLAGCIPDFKFNDAVGEGTFLREEGGADGGFFVGLKSVRNEAKDEGGLR